MKDITFNTSSWHSRLYKRAYDTSKLPDNMCPYFWRVVFVIVTLPVSWMVVLGNWQVDYGGKIALGIVVNLVLAVATVLGCAINMEFLHWWTDPYWIAYTILGLVLIALFFGIAALLIGSVGFLRQKISPVTNRDSLVGAKFISWKEKVCPKISWKETNEEENI